MERLRRRKGRVTKPGKDQEQNINDEGGPATHKCLHCDKVFSREDTLDEHEVAVHLKMAEQCFICSKVFSSNQALRRHFVTHSSQRPHQCQSCSKSFKRKDSLTYHVHTVHADVSGTPDRRQNVVTTSQCDFCLKYKCPRHHLISVVRYGKPYAYHQCTVCLKITQNCELHWSHQNLLHVESDMPMMQGNQCERCKRLFGSHKALQRHCRGKCHSLESSIPLYNSVSPLSEATMKSWMEREMDRFKRWKDSSSISVPPKDSCGDVH